MKGYKEGIHTFIETLDARTQLLNAELQVNISRNKVRIAGPNMNGNQFFTFKFLIQG